MVTSAKKKTNPRKTANRSKSAPGNARRTTRSPKAKTSHADALQLADYASQIQAIHKSHAVIEFTIDGMVITSNANFLQTLGYSIDEVVGKHHSTFLPENQKNTEEYQEFWRRLKRGEYQAGEFRRVGKGGRELWLQASYNPVLNSDGVPFKVVKYATDITEQKLRNADFSGQISAIRKSQAVIEFRMDGTILDANENFCKTMGYTLEEIRNKHHSMFAETKYSRSQEYADFWAQLNRGEYFSGEFCRLAKGGREIWLQASYNPILGLNGRPVKVVKYAADITAQKELIVRLANSEERERQRQEEARKVEQLLSIVDSAAQGDLTRKIEVTGDDSIGRIGQGLEKFFKDLRGSVSGITENSQTLATASSELAAVSSEMKSTAGNTAQEANVVSSTSQQVSQNVQCVAASVEQMNSSIREIARSATEAATIAK